MTDRQPIRPASAPHPVAAYSPAMRAGELVFTAGQVGVDPDSGQLVEGGAAAQAEQALANLARILAAANSGLDRALKVTIFLAQIGDFAAVNEVYARVVPQPYPARTTVAVAALPLGALVEIEVVALAGGETP